MSKVKPLSEANLFIRYFLIMAFGPQVRQFFRVNKAEKLAWDNALSAFKSFGNPAPPVAGSYILHDENGKPYPIIWLGDTPYTYEFGKK